MTIAGDCFGRGKDPRKDEGVGFQHDKRESPEVIKLICLPETGPEDTFG